MKKDAVKNKIIYFTSLTGMCAALIAVAYFFFLRTIKVDVMSSMQLIYTGENNAASVEAVNTMEDINQRIQAFYNTVEYTVEPDSHLYNGEVITITANYDQALAAQYHFEPVHVTKQITVSGLPDRYGSAEELDHSWIEQIKKEMTSYVMDHQEIELASEIDQNGPDPVKMETCTLEYMAFLKSDDAANADRIAGLYQVAYDDNGETKNMYYLVLVPNINDSKTIDTKNIYGERAYMSETEIDQSQFEQYIDRFFGSQYRIEPIFAEVQETEK